MPVSVVVAAYGPTRITRAAVARARSLVCDGGKVFVIAALGPGIRPVAAIVDSSVKVMEGVGSKALVEALEQVPEGNVLYVHDDILVTPRAFRAMRAALAAGASLVVPYSNDLGMDHFCGPLPSTRNAASAVDSRAVQLRGEAERPRVIRPSCIMGSNKDLLGITGSHIVDPRLKLDVVDLDIWIAPGAVVTHDSECTRRMSAPQGDEKPLITAAMIVKDEEEMLPAALGSLQGLVDKVIVCDTGSTDRTVEIAESYGATVIHRAWGKDFGSARTHALESAADSWWVLTVDADDRIVCADRAIVRKLLATYIGEYEAFSILVESQGADGTAASAFDSPRLFRGGVFHYVGAVHEVLRDISTSVAPFAPRLDLMKISHVGYSPAVMEDKGKYERNLTLAREAFERDPSVKHTLEYARSIKLSRGDPKSSYVLLRSVLDQLIADGTEDVNRKAIAYILSTMAIDKLEMSEAEEALEHCREALHLVPADDVAARTFAQAALALERPHEVIDMEAWRATTTSVSPVFQSPAAQGAVLALLAVSYLNVGRFHEAMLTAVASVARAPAAFNAWDGFVAALASVAVPADTARFCLEFCANGGLGVEAVQTGLVAAMVVDDTECFLTLAGFADRLSPEVVDRIAARAEDRGMAGLAEALRAGCPSVVS